MLLSEKEARAICEKLLRSVTAEDAVVSVNSEDTSHLRFAANAFTTSGQSAGVAVQSTHTFAFVYPSDSEPPPAPELVHRPGPWRPWK